MSFTAARLRTQTLIIAMAIAGLFALVAAARASAAPPLSARAAAAQQCSDSQWPSTRSSSNPLQLPTPPGSDPLTGARFFTPGPAHGMAAGAIASLLGLDPSSFPDSTSYADFYSSIQSDPATAAQLQNPSTQADVQALAKIASQPEAQRVSVYSGGGGPGAIYGQTQKILCHNLSADPGSIPILETFFIYPNGQYCPSPAALAANQDTFKRQVTEFAQGIGRHPAVVLAELDSIGTAACMNVPKGTGHTIYYWAGHKKHRHLVKRFIAAPPKGAELTMWASDLAYEIDQLEQYAPNTAIYTEGGYSDGNAPLWTAQMLKLVLSELQGMGGSTAALRGFYTNDTHEAWTADELSWAYQVSNLLAHMTGYRAYYVVNTSENGRGPLLPSGSKVKNGNEVLCNPPGRGLGPADNTSPASSLAGAPRGFNTAAGSYLDAFLWVHAPGRSSGSCNGGPAPGVFWPQRAEQLAQNANAQLGPGWPSHPY